MSDKIVWISCTVLVFVFATFAFGSLYLYFAEFFSGFWTNLLDALFAGVLAALFIRVAWTVLRIWRGQND